MQSDLESRFYLFVEGNPYDCNSATSALTINAFKADKCWKTPSDVIWLSPISRFARTGLLESAERQLTGVAAVLTAPKLKRLHHQRVCGDVQILQLGQPVQRLQALNRVAGIAGSANIQGRQDHPMDLKQ